MNKKNITRILAFNQSLDVHWKKVFKQSLEYLSTVIPRMFHEKKEENMSSSHFWFLLVILTRPPSGRSLSTSLVGTLTKGQSVMKLRLEVIQLH
jgi:hypothetical protein